MTLLRLGLICTDKGTHPPAKLGDILCGHGGRIGGMYGTGKIKRAGDDFVALELDPDRGRATIRCPRCGRDEQRRYPALLRVAQALCTDAEDEHGFRPGVLDISHLPS